MKTMKQKEINKRLAKLKKEMIAKAKLIKEVQKLSVAEHSFKELMKLTEKQLKGIITFKKSILPTQKLGKSRFKDLFDYLGDKDCDTTLKNTKIFCKDNNLDFEKLKKILENTGGYCDCEVLYNSEERIDKDRIIQENGKINGKNKTKTIKRN